MDHTAHNKIVSFIWSIADDCLRDVFVRGKYRDVILPMFVLRRLDCLLEPTKQEVRDELLFQTEDAGLTELDPVGLREASGYVFYNTSEWTLKSLLGNPSQLEANIDAYLNGFSDNVKEIIVNFDLRTQVRKMIASDVLFDVIEKFVSEDINLTPYDKRGPDGRVQPALTNLGMGYVFEELIRKFNEENNEEAGEHFTPREVIKLMTHLLFDPVKDELPPVLTVYDPACGSGGMLTEAQNFITDPDGGIKSTADVYIYGKEVNPETFAICKSDMMIKGNNPENIKLGSTLATNDFSTMKFDFMLSNPPYGKSWKTDQKYIKDGKDVLDPRFQVDLANYDGEIETCDATPRSSDGQLLFLMEMVDKMRKLANNPQGSRIASVHNGSSLFTGDAGGGESNIRRHLIEKDMVEAIIQLPNNLFYNTGITTYIWVVTNNKPAHRKGKVQLINASEMYTKRRKNLGEKNCDLSDDHIETITDLYMSLADEGVSKVFDNADFGYYKVTVERPLRKKAQFTPERIATLRFTSGMQEVMGWVYDKYGDDVYANLKDHNQAIQDYLEREEITLSPKNRKALLDPKTWIAQRGLMEEANRLMASIGQELFDDFNIFKSKVDSDLKARKVKLTAAQKNQILNAVSWRDEDAAKVIKKVHKFTSYKLDNLLAKLDATAEELPDHGYWPTGNTGEYIEYEADSEMRDSEKVPLKDDIHAYFLREVRPHVDDAWLDISSVKIGYEISFNRYFYQHKPLRDLNEVAQDILELEKETEGLLKRLVSLTGERA
ncbi:type I restriction-modification system subunit M [Ruegeria marisrubri]|uniref:type I restriction-modification system subunit M n=1 Tax=Ruegeria marisrubri TaxID=1685379 RepID=UPI001CD1F460|nr:class I SAM-dependent DNA methyltransferase [Ruegeria marisrubri]MCA0907738.1 type I restriction-modification system subunit M [Ruegeria marisrubri]